jgi:hypothetical protein
MSTEVSSPTARGMNIDYSNDQSELLKKMNKILEKQTGIMETESQEKKINESQRNAQSNIMLRRP